MSARAHGRITVSLPARKLLIDTHNAVTPETFSRMLQALSKKGLIEVLNEKVTILDTEALRRAYTLIKTDICMRFSAAQAVSRVGIGGMLLMHQGTYKFGPYLLRQQLAQHRKQHSFFPLIMVPDNMF